MEDLKSLYLRIENPIDNKTKWNMILNTYSASYDYEDFYSSIINRNKQDNSLLFDIEDKKTFCLVMWSIWKDKILNFNDDDLRTYIENKDFEYDIYDVIGKVRNLESIRTYSDLERILSNPDINKYFSELFDDYNHKVVIFSSFDIKTNLSFNTVLSIKIDAIKLYKFLKIYINECLKMEIPYYIKFNECGKKIIINFYSTIENFRKNEEILKVLIKENYMYFHNNNDLLAGSLGNNIALKNKDVFNSYQYSRERSLIFFKSFDSVTYEYVTNHLNTLVSYKDGRMNIIEYLATYVTEKELSKLIDNNIKSTQDYYNVANNGDLDNLKKFIKNKLANNLKDILKERLYLKPAGTEIPLKINNKTIKISIETILSGIRSLVITLMTKDSSLEKAYRIRIKNECQFYGVDYDKFCLDSGFVKKLFYDKKTYDEYQKQILEIHNDIMKIENLENLISSEIDEDTRTKIKNSMSELNEIFNNEDSEK